MSTRRRLRPAALLSGLFMLSGCAQPVTAVELTVDYPAGLGIDELVFIAFGPGNQQLLTPASRPREGEQLSPDGVTVVVVFDDTLAGQVVRVEADALHLGELRAEGEVPVALEWRQVVSATLPVTLVDELRNDWVCDPPLGTCLPRP